LVSEYAPFASKVIDSLTPTLSIMTTSTALPIPTSTSASSKPPHFSLTLPPNFRAPNSSPPTTFLTGFPALVSEFAPFASKVIDSLAINDSNAVHHAPAASPK
jgi:hypothetical protein